MKQKKIAIIMGSNSDWPVMKHAADILDQFNIPYEAKVVSAHRTPDLMFDFAESSNDNGIGLI
ncbi:MAG: AIR carboxylase family protein, partial [Methylophilaceae bacterium]